VILANTTPATVALQRETRTIPVVFVIVSDPVGAGLVSSLPRPGGNITGFINIEASLGGKWAEILKEVFPEVLHAAVLFNPDTASYFAYYVRPFEAAARSLGIEPIISPIHSNAEIESVIGAVAAKPRSSFVMLPDVFVNTKERRDLITSLAARYRMPGIYPYAYMVPDGGLISYGIDQVDLFSRSPAYLDRILRGESPAELPVQLPTKFEMAVNLKTARELGLTLPATLLGRADSVIE
jgi:putative ABC transport system substrate-binding protein